MQAFQCRSGDAVSLHQAEADFSICSASETRISSIIQFALGMCVTPIQASSVGMTASSRFAHHLKLLNFPLQAAC